MEKRELVLARVLTRQFGNQQLTIRWFCILGIVLKFFEFFQTKICSGREVFLAKIGNMDKDHPNFMSFSNFLDLNPSTFRPRLTHAFVNFDEFPARFSDFRIVILSKLELPRRANFSFAIHCDFFGAIHSLDEDRYCSVLAQWRANGRPLEISKRKIYVLCDWESVIRLTIGLRNVLTI